MSEQDEKETEKQTQIKDKLKDMGVMRDDNAAPKQETIPFWRSKLGLFIVLAVGVFALLWWTQKPTDVQRVTQSPATSTPVTQAPPYGYPPGPAMTQTMPPYMQGQAHRPAEHAATPDGAVGRSAQDHWGGPMTRDRDPYGPPPGWGEPMPYGYHGYYPPPPPAYYGYGPYYGPPPGYGYPYGWQPYPPPPPAQAAE